MTFLKNQQAIALFVLGFALLLLGAWLAGWIPTYAEYCEQNAQTHQKDCSTYHVALIALWQVGKVLDASAPALTAIATGFIAWFTLTLKRSTDKLWDAGERQMELVKQNAIDQSRDMLASVNEAARAATAMEEVAKHIAISAQAAKESVATVKERAAAQMRAYISVIVGQAVYQEREKNFRFEAKPFIVNNGFTPALKVRYRAKAAIIIPPIPSDFDFYLPAPMTVGGSVVGSQQNSIISAIVADYVPDEHVESIKAGTKGALHVWGVVEYEDIFGEPHETEFCQCLIWQPNGNIYGWHIAAHSRAT